MSELIQAIKDGDIVKIKGIFTEKMKEKVHSVIESQKIEIARSVVIEGEEQKDDDIDDEEDEDSEDDGEEDEHKKDED